MDLVQSTSLMDAQYFTGFRNLPSRPQVQYANRTVLLRSRGDIMETRLWVAYALTGIMLAIAVSGSVYLRRISLKKKNEGYRKKRIR